MPQEILRDVLRTGDTVERTRRRLSILPLSIAAHVAAATLFVIVPLAAEIEIPIISSPGPGPWMPTVPPPPPPPPAIRSPSPTPPTTDAAPTSAPSEIKPELPSPPGPTGDPVPGAPDVGSSSGVPGGVFSTASAPPPEVVPPPPPPQKLARVGFQGIREPKKVFNVLPEYPVFARQAGVQGAVILEAVLDENGNVKSVRVLTSKPLLDDAAIRAVRQWRYTPTLLNGIPVPVLMTITVNFQLSR